MMFHSENRIIQPELKIVDVLIGLEPDIGVVVDLRQGFVTVLVGIDVGIPAAGVHFLQQPAAVPDEAGFVFEAAVFFQTAFTDAPVQCVVLVHPRLFVPAAAFVSAEHFRLLQPVVQVVVQVVLAAVGRLMLDGVAVVVVVKDMIV